MAEDSHRVDPPESTAASGLTARRIAKWAGITLAAVLAVLLLAFALLNTDPGRRFVADRIEALEFQNGLTIGIGKLDGSLFGTLTVEQLTLSDPQGAFLTVPKARLDWRPLRYLRGHLDIRSLTADSATLSRLPKFKPVPPDNQPLLPDLDIDVGTFRVGQFIAEAPVGGERRVLALSGKAHIRDGRAIVAFDGQTLGTTDQQAAGDRLHVNLDAVPSDNRFDVAVKLYAPKTGVVAALAGLKAPLQVDLAGKGVWSRWDGALKAQLGEESLANLAISARDAHFTLKGETRLARLFSGQTAGLFGPVAKVDLAADLDQRRVALTGAITSDSMRIDSRGTVDLGANRFDKLNLSLALLRPASLAKNLSGSGLRGTFMLDGAFAEPEVDYDISAAHIGINDIGIDRLHARGVAQVSSKGFTVPLEAQVARITGLDSIAGGTLDNVRLTGTLAVQGSRVLSDNLRLRSPRIDAKATIIADLAKGYYAGGIDGKINDYRIESVGIFNVSSNLKLTSAAAGGYAIAGRVQARSTRILNDSLASFLGGQALAAANLRYGTDGIVRLDTIRLTAPLVQVLGGTGSYWPDGRIAAQLDARTERYGPVALTLAGTLDKPHAIVTAAHPGFGIGLADLSAEITGAGKSYRLNAKGQTDFGPLTADVTLDAADALGLTINSANLGGIDFTGSLRQTAQGPFVGRLLANGRGLGGVAQLSALGAVQQADFNLRARNTQLDGAAGLSVGSAIVDGRILLYEQPQIALDAQLANARYGTLRLSAARAKIDYRAGRGEAQFVLEGSSAFPFRLAANARMTPELWQATLAGRVRGIDVATKGAARVVPRGGTYELLPTRITAGKGTISLAGKYGSALFVQSRIENLDIGLVNAFIPDMGLGGTASGSIDFAQAGAGAFPSADARVKIANFTRTTAVSVSDPVNVNLAGKLLADGGELRAVFRSGSNVVGQLQANLRPLGPEVGGWVNRLMGAPLSGGLRYNGPAGTLFSLAGQAQQRLSGPIALAADFSGRVRTPQLAGIIKGKNLTYEYLAFGTRLTDLAIDGRFVGDRIELTNVTAKAGDGTVKAQGSVSLAADRGFPMDVAIELNNARLANSDKLGATATGSLRLTKSAGETALLTGELRLPDTRYKLVRETVAEVPKLTGVRFKPRGPKVGATGDEQVEHLANLFDRVRLDIKLSSPGKLFVSGMGLESEWRANLAFKGTNAQPRLSGSLALVRGTLGFAGHSFKLQEGRIEFTGGIEYDPQIVLAAQEDVDGLSVTLNVSGKATNPQISFTSVPSLPQDEIMARILFGRSVGNLSAIQALQLAASLNSLRGSGSGLNPLDKLRSATGIDRLRVLGADDTTGRGTAIAAGKYITDNIYIEVITDARGYTATQLEISLSQALSILSHAGGSGTSDVSIQYEKNY